MGQQQSSFSATKLKSMQKCVSLHTRKVFTFKGPLQNSQALWSYFSLSFSPDDKSACVQKHTHTHECVRASEVNCLNGRGEGWKLKSCNIAKSRKNLTKSGRSSPQFKTTLRIGKKVSVNRNTQTCSSACVCLLARAYAHDYMQPGSNSIVQHPPFDRFKRKSDNNNRMIT